MNLATARKQALRTAPAQPPFHTRANLLSSIGRIEKQGEARKPDVHQDKITPTLEKAYLSFLKNNSWSVMPTMSAAPIFLKLCNSMRNMHCSAQEIQEFCFALTDFQEMEYFGPSAGIFLSALIENSNDQKFELSTPHLSTPLEHLGHGTTKTIVVHGDVGEYAGSGMRGGELLVKGNSAGRAGDSMLAGSLTIEGNADCAGEYMSGGTVTVCGNCGPLAGFEMRGGTLIIKKNAGNALGRHMHGGTIIVEGNASSGLSAEYGGEIILYGNAGSEVGYRSIGGTKSRGIIRINGEIESIADDIEGALYHKGVLIIDRRQTDER